MDKVKYASGCYDIICKLRHAEICAICSTKCAICTNMQIGNMQYMCIISPTLLKIMIKYAKSYAHICKKPCAKYVKNMDKMAKPNMHKYAFSKFQNMHFICILYQSMQIYASCA